MPGKKSEQSNMEPNASLCYSQNPGIFPLPLFRFRIVQLKKFLVTWSLRYKN